MLLVSQTLCPSCGAPIAVRDGQRHAICTYCSTSLRVDREPPAGRHPLAAGASAPPGTVQLTDEKVSKEDIERLKQLVLDGKRDEAVAHYQRAVSVPRAEAEQAVNQMLLCEHGRMTRQMPINAFGFVLYGVLICGPAALAAWGATRVLESGSYALLAVAGAAFSIWMLTGFIPKVASTIVFSFGAEGRARVLRRAILRTEAAHGAAIVQVLFEVEPSNGGARFTDEEILFLAEASVPKLEPGNVIMVRYDEPGRRRVFPVAPITVVGTAGSSYRG